METIIVIPFILYCFVFVLSTSLKITKRRAFCAIVTVVSLLILSLLWSFLSAVGQAGAGAALAGVALLFVGFAVLSAFLGMLTGFVAAEIRGNKSKTVRTFVTVFMFILPLLLAPFAPTVYQAYETQSKKNQEEHYAKISHSEANLTLGIYHVKLPYAPPVTINTKNSKYNHVALGNIQKATEFKKIIARNPDYKINQFIVHHTPNSSRNLDRWCGLVDPSRKSLWCDVEGLSQDIKFSLLSEKEHEVYLDEIIQPNKVYPKSKTSRLTLLSTKEDMNSKSFIYRDDEKLDARDIPVHIQCKIQNDKAKLSCKMQYAFRKTINVNVTFSETREGITERIVKFYKDFDLIWNTVNQGIISEPQKINIRTTPLNLGGHIIDVPVTPHVSFHIDKGPNSSNRYKIYSFSDADDRRHVSGISSRNLVSDRAFNLNIALRVENWCNQEDPFKQSFLCRPLMDLTEGGFPVKSVNFIDAKGTGGVAPRNLYKSRLSNIKYISSKEKSALSEDRLGLWQSTNTSIVDINGNAPMAECRPVENNEYIVCKTLYPLVSGVIAKFQFKTHSKNAQADLTASWEQVHDLWHEIYVKVAPQNSRLKKNVLGMKKQHKKPKKYDMMIGSHNFSLPLSDHLTVDSWGLSDDLNQRTFIKKRVVKGQSVMMKNFSVFPGYRNVIRQKWCDEFDFDAFCNPIMVGENELKLNFNRGASYLNKLTAELNEGEFSGTRKFNEEKHYEYWVLDKSRSQDTIEDFVFARCKISELPIKRCRIYFRMFDDLTANAQTETSLSDLETNALAVVRETQKWWAGLATEAEL